MTEVRRHTRKTASGKTARVRQHHRRGGDGEDRGRQAPEREPGGAFVGDMQPAASAAPAGDFWAEDDAPPAGDWWADDDPDEPELAPMKDEMRHWRSLPEPEPGPDRPMSPQMTKLLGLDTPEGRATYDRGRGYREAGYTGPLDENNRIPDPDDPAEQASLSALAGLRRIGNG